MIAVEESKKKTVFETKPFTGNCKKRNSPACI
jgi:hypothetical protein